MAFFLKMSRPKTSAFDPTQIDNCSCWLEADAGVTLVGSAVSAWADQSGNGKNVSEASYRPTYVENQANGHPIIRFDQKTLVWGWGSFAQSENTTVFVVLKQAATNSGDRFMVYKIASGYETIGFGCILTDNKPAIRYNLNSSSALNSGIGTEAFNILRYRWEKTGANQTTYYTAINGGTEVSGTSTLTSPSFWNNIGSDTVVSYRPFYGDIAAIVIYSATLASNDISAFEEAYASKYGISLS